MNLPEGTYLAYTVTHEAWHGDNWRSVMVTAAHPAGGVAWEFHVIERDLLGKAAIQVRIFDDAFAAFGQVPEFFTALDADAPRTLAGVRSILDGLGATDLTVREEPAPVEPTADQIAYYRELVTAEYDALHRAVEHRERAEREYDELDDRWEEAGGEMTEAWRYRLANAQTWRSHCIDRQKAAGRRVREAEANLASLEMRGTA